MTRIRATLLTPAAAVAAVALYATFAVTAGTHLRAQFTAEPTAAPSATASPTPAYTVAGKVRLQPGQYQRHGQACRSTTIGPDAQVIVTDAHGAALTYAALSTGRVADGYCDLPFTATVPAGEGTYGLDVPHWGEARYTEPELAGLIDVTFG